MKKRYIKPYLEIITGVLNASLLDSSTSGGGEGGNGGDPTTPIKPTPPPGGEGPIVDSKQHFNAWENWDEY